DVPTLSVAVVGVGSGGVSQAGGPRHQNWGMLLLQDSTESVTCVLHPSPHSMFSMAHPRLPSEVWRSSPIREAPTNANARVGRSADQVPCVNPAPVPPPHLACLAFC